MMRNPKILAKLRPALLCAAVLICHITCLCSGIAAQDTDNVSLDAAQDKAAQQARIAFTHDLPHTDGNRLKVTIVEVT